jgi:hypothetical protein
VAASGGPRRSDRVLTAVTNPAVLLSCLGGGGVAWVAGAPALSSALVAGAMAAAAAAGATTAMSSSWPSRGWRGRAAGLRGRSSLRAGTEQARLAAELDAQVRDLRSLRASAMLPELLTDPVVEALVAAGGAREVGVRVARAVDALDAALDRAHGVGESVPPSPASAAVLARMYQRRQRLLAALRDGLAQVQDVHAQLLELSATAALPGLPGMPGLEEVAADVLEVGVRLDLLRRSFADLDATTGS